jgi:ubiquinone/menaquinone biosynthesis C-methylase UbiE
MGDQLSATGEAWRSTYRQGLVSWCNPQDLTVAHLLRFASSHWVKTILEPCQFEHGRRTRILEAGCGTGLYSLALAVRGFSVVALDYCEEALDIARHLKGKVERAGYCSNVIFLQASITEMPFEAAQFDLVFNQAVLEYFLDYRERSQALLEMVRVTKPGGCVSVIAQHTGHAFGRLWAMSGWPGYTDQPPVLEYSTRNLGRDLRRAGLSDITTDGLYPWKAFFFWPQWYERWAVTHQAVYLLGAVLQKFGWLPRPVRRILGVQIAAQGKKR